MKTVEYARSIDCILIRGILYDSRKGRRISMINMVNMTTNNSNYRQNEKNISTYNSVQNRKCSNGIEEKIESKTDKQVCIQEVYEKLKNRVMVNNANEDNKLVEQQESNSDGLTVCYQGIPLESWALTDPKYTDEETGISWYIRDGKYPYMVGKDVEKFEKLCEESGEFALKKFAEMTGLIKQLDEDTIAYVGDNGIAIKSKNGKELFVDTSQLSYDIIKDMFDNLSVTDDYFEEQYWERNIEKFAGMQHEWY